MRILRIISILTAVGASWLIAVPHQNFEDAMSLTELPDFEEVKKTAHRRFMKSGTIGYEILVGPSGSSSVQATLIGLVVDGFIHELFGDQGSGDFIRGGRWDNVLIHKQQYKKRLATLRKRLHQIRPRHLGHLTAEHKRVPTSLALRGNQDIPT